MANDRLIIKKRGTDEYKTFSIRIKNELVTKIDNIAARSERSRNEIINLLLEYGVEHAEIK